MKLKPTNRFLGLLRRFSTTSAIAICLGGLFLAPAASAESISKANNELDLNLGASWQNGAAPGSSDVATWDATVTSGNTTNLGADLEWAGMAVANPGGPVTLNGTHTLTLFEGVTLGASAPLTTLNVPVILWEDQTWNITAGGGPLVVNGPISDLGALTKDGGGTLTLGGTNTYTGATVIANGTLKLSAPTTAAPADLSGLVVHLDATQLTAANNSNVATWENLVTVANGGVGNFAATAGTQPTFQAEGNLLNGLPLVKFNNSAMLSNTTNFGNTTTVLFVGRMDGGSNRRLVGGVANNWLMGYWGGGHDKAHFNAWLANPANQMDYTTRIYGGVLDAGTASFYHDGKLLAGPAGGFQGPNGLALGGWSGNSEQSFGSIGEVLVFNRALTDDERGQMEEYLRAKWYGTLPNTSVVTIGDGGTLDLDGTHQTIGSLAGGATAQVLLNGGTLTVGANNAASTFSGVIADGATADGVLAKTGNGTLVLDGSDSNTHTGPTVLQAGLLQLSKTGGAYAIPGDFIGVNNASPDVYATVDNQFAPGSVMYFQNNQGDHVRFELMGTTQTLGGIDNGGIVNRGVIQHREQVPAQFQVGTSSTLILDVAAGQSYDFRGYLRSTGGTVSLVKNGPGTQQFGGGQLGYSGGTTVNAGTLDFVTGNAMDAARGGWTVNAGAKIRAVAAHNVYGGLTMNGGTLEGIGDPNATWGHLVMGGNVTIGGDQTSVMSAGIIVAGNNNRTFTVNPTDDASGIDLDVTGMFSHASGNTWGYLTKAGEGTMRFAPTSYGNIGSITVNAGKIIFDGVIQGMGNGGLFNNAEVEIINPTALTHGSPIFGAGSIVKTGAGMLTLTGTTGNCTGSFEIADGGLTIGNASGTLVWPGAISGSGSLTKAGAGTLVLTGALTHTGGTTVTGGILSVPGDFDENLTVAAGAGFVGGDSLTSLSLDDANYYSTGAPLAITGALSLTGDNYVYLASPPALGTGDILLMTYGGTLTGGGTFSFPEAANYRGTPAFTTGGGQVKLTGIEFKSLTWTGSADDGNPANNAWDTLTTPNWNDGTGPDTFAFGDAVTFDDTGLRKTVTLPPASLLSPSLVTFNNSTGNNYLIAGNGVGRGFTGGTSIVKNGTGTATIQGYGHTYTGTVTINAGVLQPDGNYEMLGNSSGITVNDGGQLNINGMNLGAGVRHYSLTIEGQGPDGLGAVTNTAAASPASNAGLLNLTISADATVGGNGGRFDFGRSGSLLGTIQGNSHTLTKVGTGIVTMRGNASDITYVCNGGTLKFEDTDAATGTNPITINAGTLQGYGTRNFPNQLQLAAGTTLDNDGGGTQTWAGDLTVTSPGNVTLSARSGGLILGGAVSGDASVTKTGGSELRLLGTAPNTFTGDFLLPTNGGGVTYLGKTGGAVAIPAGATIEFGTTTLTGEAHLRMLEDHQFGAGVRINFNNPWGQWSRFDLMGTDQSLAGLSTGSPTVAGGGVVQNRESGNSTSVRGTSVLTLTGNDDDPDYPVGGYYYNGHLRDSDTAPADGFDPGNRLEIVKNGTATQTFTTSPGQVSRISFSGALTVNGGRLIGSGARNGNWGGFGAGLNTRTITVNSGGILDFAVANMWGGHNNTNVPTLVINGGTVTNSDAAEPAGKVNNALNHIVLNNGTLTSTTGNSLSTIDASRPGEIYGAWNLNGNITSSGASTISTNSPAGVVMLGSTGNDTVFEVSDGNLTVSAPLQDGDTAILAKLVKNGAGTLTLSAANVYTTNTVINDGTVVLTDTGSLRFKVRDFGSNQLAGEGSVTLNGAFTIDTSAVTATDGTWTLVDTDTLTETYGATFTVAGYSPAGGGQWVRSAGTRQWTFDQGTGVLTLEEIADPYGAWAGLAGLDGTNNGYTMDPDNDGVPNILEFYIDGDPLANDASNLPQPEVTDDYLVFTFNRRDDAAALALTQEFQYGSTLVDWTTVSIAPGNYAGVIVEVADGAEVDTVTVKIPRTLEVAGKLFGRLNIEMPER